MNDKNRGASVRRIFLLAIVCALGFGAAVAQVSEEQRAATEEAQRQIAIARTIAANVRQLSHYSIDGRSGRSGSPTSTTFLGSSLPI